MLESKFPKSNMQEDVMNGTTRIENVLWHIVEKRLRECLGRCKKVEMRKMVHFNMRVKEEPQRRVTILSKEH